MEKKLKVTWQGGSWNHQGGEQPTASTELPENARITAVGEDTLVFQVTDTNGTVRVALVLPAGRLISAVLVDEDEAEAPNGPPVDPDDLALWNASADFRRTIGLELSAVLARDALHAWGDKKGLA